MLHLRSLNFHEFLRPFADNLTIRIPIFGVKILLAFLHKLIFHRLELFEHMSVKCLSETQKAFCCQISIVIHLQRHQSIQLLL